MTAALTVLVCAAVLAAAVWLGMRMLRSVPAGTQARSALSGLLWAALMGLVLFFFLESGIARRIGPDLFLPEQDGAWLPWRALRLGLCLCLALAARLWGGRAKARLRTLLEKDAGCWLVSAAVTALFFLWAWRVSVFCFMTNDDSYLMGRIASGSYRGMGAAFSHELLCAMLHGLYSRWPAMPWYGLYHLAILTLSALTAGRCLLLKVRRHSWPLAAGPLLHGLLCAGLYLCAAAELSFTVTPAAAGAAAVALILCRDETDSTAGRLASDLAAAALVLLCRLQRADTWQALYCFWLLAVGYQLLHIVLTKKPRRLLRAGTLLAAAAFTLALQGAVDRVHLPEPDAGGEQTAAVQQQELTPEQIEAAQAQAQEQEQQSRSAGLAEFYRSRVMDYLLARLSNEDLEAFGIPQELAVLLRGWYFMDPRISTDTFRAISDAYPDLTDLTVQPAEADPAVQPGEADVPAPAEEPAAPDEPDGIGVRLGRLAARVTDALRSSTADETPGRVHTMVLLALCMALLAALLLLRLLRYGLGGWLETLCGLCAGGGAALMFLYLSTHGRFPLRTFLAAAIPAVLAMALLAADDPGRPALTGPQKAGAALGAVLTAALGVLCLVTAGSVPYADQAASRRDVFADQFAVEAFTRENPDITFITNMLSNDLDPFHDPSDSSGNLHRWGGTGVTAKTDRLYADAFFRDDVLFLYQYPSTIVALLQYLTLDNGPVQARVVTQLTGDIAVADLSQLSPGADYTGWYEQNGMTYYFQNGQALTGEQTIDGQTYSFAPAGAASQFSAAPSPEGILYYTDAYSLVGTQEQTP